MLQLTNISVTFGDTNAITTLNLDFQPRKTTLLIGPSGCGKSTLLRLIAGLVNATTGEVLFEGKRLSAANITSLRHRMGYVIQEGGLFPHLSIRDNVTIMASYLNWATSKIEARLQELAEMVHISPVLFCRYPSEISGGQRQRVSLMRALMLNPEILLLDEPLGALDPMIRLELQNELKGIFNSLDTTVIMVTHDIAEAAFFADHVVLMRDGLIIQQGKLAELATAPKEPFVENFINAQRKPLQQLNDILTL